jgi:hypothetical protein
MTSKKQKISRYLQVSLPSSQIVIRLLVREIVYAIVLPVLEGWNNKRG